MPLPFSFTDKLILRTPHFPFLPAISETNITELVNNKPFLEALYLASPVLYSECEKLKAGEIKTSKETEKIKASLIKYYQRMFSRCTPFGMFAGCTVAEWGDKTMVQFAEECITRSTRLDMHYMCSLAQHLEKIPEIKKHLRFKTNNSIYRLGDEIRYVEYKYADGRRVHQISSVAASDYLLDLLHKAERGITLPEAENILSHYVDDKEEVQLFLDEILESQLLVSELEPSITGDEFLVQVIGKLGSIQDADETVLQMVDQLKNIKAKVEDIDSNKINSPIVYKQVLKTADTLELKYEEGKFFQTDLFKKAASAVVDRQLQQQLLDAFVFLNGLAGGRQNEKMAAFIKKFGERYEDKTMPLLFVLDTETGIGYPEHSGQVVSPLADKVPVPPKNNDSVTINWNKKEEWFFAKLIDAVKNNLHTVTISDADAELFKASWNDLPPSLSVMFSLLSNEKIKLETISGTSAASLAGRFACGSAAINELVRAITKKEQELNPDVLFAEIIHLPEARTGNVLLHPPFREYEIPYLAQSSLPGEQQLPLNDLYISVSGNRIRLVSKKLNKEIIPRLSNAHNYSLMALPVYHFLCDLQAQNQRTGFGFTWGALSSQFSFLPRVEYKNIVLHEATWHIKKADFKVFSEEINDLTAVAKTFCKKWNLPRYCMLADGDNELLIDFSNEFSLQAFVKALKNREAIAIKEFLFEANPVQNQKGEWFTNQFVASLINAEKTYSEAAVVLPGQSENVQSDFIPGSSWLYFKIYCGEKTADSFLAQVVKPVTENLLAAGKISEYFFIRFADPEFHIRFRVKINEGIGVDEILNSINNLSETYNSPGLTWKVQTDTYKREINRYGANSVHILEKLFFADSIAKLGFLELTEGDERENLRWPWGMKLIDAMLDCFSFSLEDKIGLFTSLKDNFTAEFSIDRQSKDAINKIYSSARNEINRFFAQPENENEDDMKSLFEIITAFSLQCGPVAAELLGLKQQNKLMVEWYSLFSSIIHMSCNRLFPANARKNEMILYVILHRYYTSQKAIEAQLKKPA